MITLKNLSYSIPEKELYHDISLTIEENGHYAFIGSNGCGKSTLIQMILSPDQYLYDGDILYSEAYHHTRCGYVSQFSDVDLNSEMTVFEYISQHFTELDHQIEALCDKMATEADLEPIFEAYQKALDQKEAIDGDHYETNIRKQLNIAGIEQLETQPLSTLSGGEFKLIQVIREMLLSPKLLFLDEPDVFLDFNHINSLVGLINSYQGTLLVITHSRYLLNHCFDHIIHLEGCEIQQFEGSYTSYQLELLTTKVELEEIVAREEAEIARQTAIVNKTRALATAIDSASLGKSVHARQTLLDRLESRKTKLPFVDIQKPKISFEVAQPIVADEDGAEGAPILELLDYAAEFDHELLDHISLQLAPTDKVAIIGRNGTGKSTILHDIAAGKNSAIHLHEKAQPAMFSQVIGNFASEDQTIEDLMMEAGLMKTSEIVDCLAQYGFSAEERTKHVSELSGGEKDLLQIALISLKKANLLLLDEPTGHLDLYAQLALEDALKHYAGGILMVSHDFYIVANCMDYVLFVDDHQIRRMSIRKFRQMVYRDFFDKDDLLFEDKKKALEVRIEALLKEQDYESAKLSLTRLEDLIQQHETAHH